MGLKRNKDSGLLMGNGSLSYSGTYYQGRGTLLHVQNGVFILAVCASDEELATVAEGLGVGFTPSKARDVLVTMPEKVVLKVEKRK